MTDSPDQRPPVALAMEWVARILAVAAEMVLPGLAGDWLDRRLGTGFWVLVGFGVGITVGLWHLILMTRSMDRARQVRQKTPTYEERKPPPD